MFLIFLKENCENISVNATETSICRFIPFPPAKKKNLLTRTILTLFPLITENVQNEN